MGFAKAAAPTDAVQATGAVARFKDLCLDAADHQARADWWCRVLGHVRRNAAVKRTRAPSRTFDISSTALAPGGAA